MGKSQILTSKAEKKKEMSFDTSLTSELNFQLRNFKREENQ